MANLANGNTAKNGRTKKEIDAISQKIKASKLNIKDIIIPISVSVILIMLGIFVFVPMIKTGIEFREEYNDIKEKEKTLEELESKLKNTDEATFQIDVLNSKEVIPKSLRVSSFMYYIDTLANNKSLVSKSLSAGDILVSIQNEEEASKNRKSYLGVSGPLSYTGNLNNILDFLDSLYSESPYIISADNVSLKKTGEGWRVTLNVTGYYVPQQSSEVSLYSKFTDYTQYKDIIDIFAEKAEKLE